MMSADYKSSDLVSKLYMDEPKTLKQSWDYSAEAGIANSKIQWITSCH